MTDSAIGWYVHHHGLGHLTRFLAVRPHLDGEVVVFSSLAAPDRLPERTRWIRLDRDDASETTPSGRPREPATSDPTASGLLHWAPLEHHGHRSRLARIAVETLRQHLAVFVVDVSVEVTLFVRLLGIPVVVVSQPGERSDEPHLLAYRAATRILAPWPRGLVELPAFRADVDVVHTGGISRWEEAGRAAGDRRGVLVLLGSGGGDVSDAAVEDLRDALPGEPLTVLGPGRAWSSDPARDLGAAEVVVSWAGQNSVADLAATRSRSIVIPQDRPFREQRTTADALARHGLAVVAPRWPRAGEWPELLARARTLPLRWELWETAGAARRAAEAIVEVGERWT